MPEGVRRAIQDVTAADATWRLDQMPINRFAAYVLAGMPGDREATMRSSEVKNVGQRVWICVSAYGFIKKLGGKISLYLMFRDPNREWWSLEIQHVCQIPPEWLFKPLMDHVSLMGFWRGKVSDSPVNISIGEVMWRVCVAADCVHLLVFPSHFHDTVSWKRRANKKLKAFLKVRNI